MGITREEYFAQAAEKEKSQLDAIAKNIWRLIKVRQEEIDRFPDDQKQSCFTTWTELNVALMSAETTISYWRRWHETNDCQTEDEINYGRAAAVRQMLNWENAHIQERELSQR